MPTVAVALKCAEPDLEVVVGTDLQDVFHYHSVILASYSGYVDAMLASPMREQKEMKITFPDIEPDVWVSLIKFLEPGGSRKAELETIVRHFMPICDRYEFLSGTELIDDMLHTIFAKFSNGEILPSGLDSDYMNVMIDAALLTVQFNLERSQPGAAKFAKSMFTAGYTRAETKLASLLPFVENDEKILKRVVNTIMGKEEMSMEEMRRVVEDDSFHSDYALKLQLISDHATILHRLEISKVVLSGSGTSEINKEFSRDYCSKGPAAMERGYSVNVFPEQEGETLEGMASLTAMDPFGKVWEVSFVPTIADEGDENPVRIVLYRWEQHYTSHVPPHHGWSAVDGPLPLPTFFNCFHR